MRETTAIKKCIYPNRNSLGNNPSQQQHSRTRQQNSSSSLSQRRRVAHSFVLEHRLQPISGLHRYWRPARGNELKPASKTSKGRKVAVEWRKSQSTNEQCPVWRCYTKPLVKAKKKLSEPKEQANQSQTEGWNKDETLRDVATQTIHSNRCNINDTASDSSENPSEENALYPEKIKEAEDVKAAAPSIPNLKALKLTEKDWQFYLRWKQRQNNICSLARGFQVPIKTEDEDFEQLKKCPTCGFNVPPSKSTDSSIDEDDSRLDDVVRKAELALERRFAVGEVFRKKYELTPDRQKPIGGTN